MPFWWEILGKSLCGSLPTEKLDNSQFIFETFIHSRVFYCPGQILHTSTECLQLRWPLCVSARGCTFFLQLFTWLFKSEQCKYFLKYKLFCILPKYQFQHRHLLFPLQPAFHPEIVLVRLKKLEWPARYVAKKGSKVEVVLLNKRKTTAEVPEDQTRPFVMANVSRKTLSWGGPMRRRKI